MSTYMPLCIPITPFLLFIRHLAFLWSITIPMIIHDPGNQAQPLYSKRIRLRLTILNYERSRHASTYLTEKLGYIPSLPGSYSHTLLDSLLYITKDQGKIILYLLNSGKAYWILGPTITQLYWENLLRHPTANFYVSAKLMLDERYINNVGCLTCNVVIYKKPKC